MQREVILIPVDVFLEKSTAFITSSVVSGGFIRSNAALLYKILFKEKSERMNERTEADSYGNKKLIRKWIKSVFVIRDPKIGQSQTYGNGFVSAWFRQLV